MSHNTGVTATSELKQKFALCDADNIRTLICIIENEEIILHSEHNVVGSWERDWDRMLLDSVQENRPCYIFYRLDDRLEVSEGFFWLFLSWSPDISSNRDKLIYAASKAHLKMTFGSNRIKNEIFINNRDDLCLAAYFRYLEQYSQTKEVMSKHELDLEEVKQNQILEDVSNGRSQLKCMGNVCMPLSAEAKQGLANFSTKKMNYVQFSFDLENEIIHLEDCDANLVTCIEALKAKIPCKGARYHLFRFQHVHETKRVISTVFVYKIPSNVCSIKERMLSSSCKSYFVDLCKNQRPNKIEFAKKIEIDDSNELSHDFLMEQLYPPKNYYGIPKVMSKPSPPNRKGNRRVIK